MIEISGQMMSSFILIVFHLGATTYLTRMLYVQEEKNEQKKEGHKYTIKGSKNLPEEYKKVTGSWFAQFVDRTLQQALTDCAMVTGRVYTLRFIGLLELRKSARIEGLCRLNRDDILGYRDTTRKDVFSAKMAEEIELQVVAAGLAGVSSLLLLASAARLRRRKKRKNREEWVSDLLSKREENGAYNQLMAELRVDDSNAFRRYLRMNCSDFEVMV